MKIKFMYACRVCVCVCVKVMSLTDMSAAVRYAVNAVSLLSG